MGSWNIWRMPSLPYGLLLQHCWSDICWFNCSPRNLFWPLHSWLCLLRRIDNPYPKWRNHGSSMFGGKLLPCWNYSNAWMSCWLLSKPSRIGIMPHLPSYFLLQWKRHELWNYLPYRLLLSCWLDFTCPLSLRHVFFRNRPFLVDSMYWMSSRSLLWLRRNDNL